MRYKESAITGSYHGSRWSQLARTKLGARIAFRGRAFRQKLNSKPTHTLYIRKYVLMRVCE
jgi:hypothetical protein